MATTAPPKTKQSSGLAEFVRLNANRATIVAFFHVVVPFVGTVVAVALLWQNPIGWVEVALLLGLFFPTFLGVTVGFHRYLVHRSFRTNRVVEAVLIVLGSMAAEGLPIFWAAGHRRHHALSDTEGDPHRPADGLLHAQFGWLVKMDSHPDYDKYARDLLRDPYIVRLNRLYPLWLALSLLLPFAVAGWTGLLWGGFVRIFLVHHIGWGVNSIGHVFGNQPFKTNDNSRNLWFLGVLAMGDGWHNNHHAFPHSAFHGLRWWQIDLSGYLIRLLEATGLAWDVRRVTPAALKARNPSGAKVNNRDYLAGGTTTTASRAIE